eukprot:m.167479 g.167479  ORF g.167479 m.167479 type:complete len:1133 (+) comp12830_c0_seq1:237-3635(+)
MVRHVQHRMAVLLLAIGHCCSGVGGIVIRNDKVPTSRSAQPRPMRAPHGTFASSGLLRQANQTDPVKQWLNHMVINIPDFSYFSQLEDSLSINISVHNFTCRDLNLGTIESSFAPPASLGVSVGQVGILCNVSNMKLTVKSFLPDLTIDGVVAAIRLTDSSIAYNVTLEMNNHSVPCAATCTNAVIDANVNPNDVYVDFKGTWKVLNLFKGSIESGIAKALKSEVASLVTQELKNLTDVNLTHVLANLAQDIDATNKSSSIMPTPEPAPPGSLNLFDAWPETVMDFLLNKVLGYDGGLLINLVVDLMTNFTGTVTLNSSAIADVAKITVPLNDLATLEVGLVNLSLGGLDTWTEFEILQVVGNVTARTQTAMDSLVLNVTAFVNVSTSSGPLVSTPLYEEFAFDLDLQHMTLHAMTDIVANKTKVDRLGFRALGSSIGCTLDELMDFNTSFLHMDLQDESLTIAPVGGDLEDDIDGLINRVVLLLLTGYHTAMPDLLGTILAGPLVHAIDGAVMTAKNDTNCTEGAPTSHVNVQEQRDDAFKGRVFAICWFIVTALTTVMALMWTVYPEGQEPDRCCGSCRSPRQKNDDDDDLVTINGGRRHLYEDDKADDDVLLDPSKRRRIPRSINKPVPGLGDSLDDDDDKDPVTQIAMVLDGRVPLWVRVGMVSILLANTFLFISANTTTGGSALVAITVDEHVWESPSLFSFSLGNTIRDMWTAKCYPLSVIVTLFTGIWPYSKLVIMMVSWVLPARMLSHALRMRVVQFTDAVGKWSLLDSFLMIVFMVAFRLHIEKTIPGSVPEQAPVHVAVDVVVSPQWGLYGYLAATCLSLALNHAVVHYMRVVEVDQFSTPPTDDRVALNAFTFTHNGRTVYFLRNGRILVSALLLLSLLLFCAGLSVEAFNFEFMGMAGWVLDPTLHGKNIQRFSVISLYEQLNVRPMFITTAGLQYLRLAFLMFTVVLPLAQLVILQILWLVPLTETTQWRALVTAEILNAWQSIDVFALAIIASLTEIRQFSKFLIGDKADFLEPFLHEYFDAPLQGDDTVFDVIATLDKGCWLLVASTLVQFIVGSAILSLCNTALEQQAAARADRPHKSTSKSLAFFHRFLPSLLSESATSVLIDGSSPLLNDELRA